MWDEREFTFSYTSLILKFYFEGEVCLLLSAVHWIPAGRFYAVGILKSDILETFLENQVQF